jgi:NAD(P)-dependent dehydrogenase (short-subunit alcohol dehydrogenase family)
VAVPICPGFVAGEMTDRTIRGIMVRGGLSEAEATKKVAAVNPQRRIISAEEVAEAVALICSGQIPSLTGEPLLLNGGA